MNYRQKLTKDEDANERTPWLVLFWFNRSKSFQTIYETISNHMPGRTIFAAFAILPGCVGAVGWALSPEDIAVRVVVGCVSATLGLVTLIWILSQIP